MGKQDLEVGMLREPVDQQATASVRDRDLLRDWEFGIVGYCALGKLLRLLRNPWADQLAHCREDA